MSDNATEEMRANCAFNEFVLYRYATTRSIEAQGEMQIGAVINGVPILWRVKMKRDESSDLRLPFFFFLIIIYRIKELCKAESLHSDTAKLTS